LQIIPVLLAYFLYVLKRFHSLPQIAFY
jgi:hypothetical protein